MVSQIFLPGTPTPTPFRSGNQAGVLRRESPRDAAESLEVRTLQTPGHLCEPESLTGPPTPVSSDAPPPHSRLQMPRRQHLEKGSPMLPLKSWTLGGVAGSQVGSNPWWS